MELKELIKKLETIYKEHGNLDVWVPDDLYSGYYKKAEDPQALIGINLEEDTQPLFVSPQEDLEIYFSDNEELRDLPRSLVVVVQ